MNLSGLRESLRRSGATLSLRDGGRLFVVAPPGSLSPETIAALKAYRDVSVAWGLRRRVDRWPDEWPARWGFVANELEERGGLRFPASEIEASRLVVAEMQAPESP